eukprot:CAMPEP_0171466602 /NCGR_PEP_ID=MMETSP0945-20130129/9376_1 /TAXON_ID=109269 /ORGANISM="Vaucheria litorea, Strain CCMP2940" /LENGTH=52 /DNA_ID=CAMNT_0011994765 /DNA_START=29 /DNA_END=183 /DNA_ORIENTATION=+
MSESLNKKTEMFPKDLMFLEEEYGRVTNMPSPAEISLSFDKEIQNLSDLEKS